MTLIFANIKQYLKAPYPYYYDNKTRLLVSLGLISVLSFGFSYFFEPFEVNASEHKIPSFYILLIHAFLPLPIAFFYFSMVNLRKHHISKWTIGKEFLVLSMLLLSLGICSFLIRDVVYTNPNNWSLRYFYEEIRNTFLVGILLITVILPLNLERLTYKHQSLLKQITISQDKKEYLEKVLIKNSTSHDSFELMITNFLYAKVESNYTEVYTYSDKNVSKMLIRITLKDFEKQLESYSQILRTHRSYIVNLDMVTSIAGNAQGYELSLKHSTDIIPVSRSLVKHFNSVYSKL
ncbi:MAG: LytR/AlgR family response regulator transcription factor [Winogradskyella sp.]|uniref:LytR/AlgR family response regulator transcription factor n=1 Tax=Winogradskyella sp. TaxID=1883156 RepID=UPI0038596C6E